ncbi:MAG: helix-turn-helix domain-containing protein [Ignavibacteriae bacterium]|nr:helix-turn-helix domain-containing protein [Ignavibacteriota bacterium]
MSFSYQEKQSSSPLVDVVWRTEDQTDGIYIASADACWDMIFITSREGKTTVLLSGPCFKTTRVPYTAGNKNFGIKFSSCTVFTNIPVASMVNVTKSLPMPTENSFELQGITWKLPTYESVDQFVAELENRGLIKSDPIIKSVLEDKNAGISQRSVQRHFIKTIGMSPRRVKQIIAARTAVGLLLQGAQIAEVAYKLGYADQAHMTRMLKRFTDYTPLGNKIRNQKV